MLSVEEAQMAVFSRISILPTTVVALAESLGCVLAEDIVADLDLPPFSKALVDGFAVRSSDLAGDDRRLRVVEEILAGKIPTRPLGRREAAEIMTGAPLPFGSDAVVMVEKTRRDGEIVFIDDLNVAPGRNWLPQGREMRAGEVVLKKGALLNAPKLGLLASVGRLTVAVTRRPRVAIITTGDELVDPSTRPGPGQIRNSNATLLRALVETENAEFTIFPNAPDEFEPLRRIIAVGLSHDVLLMTGGVSAGNRDLVPGVLKSLDVEGVFHKVRVRPGKPLWFGIGPDRMAQGPGPLVFGLPGNPVSGLIGFLLFVRPALWRMLGRTCDLSQASSGRLERPFRHQGDRVTYHPSHWSRALLGEIPRIDVLDWAGSADLRTVANADGFAIFPAGDRDYSAGEIVGFLPLG